VPSKPNVRADKSLPLKNNELNNTWLYDEQGYCDPTVIFSDTICLVRRGNYFMEDESTSWHWRLKQDIREVREWCKLNSSSPPRSSMGICLLLCRSCQSFCSTSDRTRHWTDTKRIHTTSLPPCQSSLLL
jgi:hypothetical protein